MGKKSYLPRETQLRMVFVLTRHGSRTPCHRNLCMDVEFNDDLLKHPPYTFFPVEIKHSGNDKAADWFNKPSISDSYLRGGKCLPGELVGKGAADQHHLGKTLRKAYIENENFLSETYNEKEIFVQSSKKRRTVESMRCILSGLYPNNVNSEIKVPIYVSDTAENVILPYNPYTDFLAKSIISNPQIIPGLQDAILKIEKEVKTNNNLNVSSLWDNLITMKEMGIYPKISDNLWNLISTWGYKWFIARVLGTEEHRFNVLRFSSGMLIDFILRKTEQLSTASDVPKFFLFSGHDGTLLCLLHAIGLQIKAIPPTSSCIRLEIHEDTEQKKLFVKLIFNDKELAITETHQQMCQLSTFVESVSKYRLTKNEHRLLCESHDAKLAELRSKI